VVEARLLPCISKIKYGKQELSPRWRGSVNRDKTKGNLDSADKSDKSDKDRYAKNLIDPFI